MQTIAQQVEVPKNLIDPNDVVDFETMRREVYKATSPDAPDRRERLTELADLVSARRKAGQASSIHDLVLKSLEEQADLGEIKRVGYRFTLDEQGKVIGIDRVDHLPQNRQATEAAQHAAARIGWGHKQNWSQIRVSEKRLPGRRIHI